MNDKVLEIREFFNAVGAIFTQIWQKHMVSKKIGFALKLEKPFSLILILAIP